MCWVMPPASPAATSALRIASRSEVLPWSTWPRMQTTGGRGTRNCVSSSSGFFFTLSFWTCCCCVAASPRCLISRTKPCFSATFWATASSMFEFIEAKPTRAFNSEISLNGLSPSAVAKSRTITGGLRWMTLTPFSSMVTSGGVEAARDRAGRGRRRHGGAGEARTAGGATGDIGGRAGGAGRGAGGSRGRGRNRARAPIAAGCDRGRRRPGGPRPGAGPGPAADGRRRRGQRDRGWAGGGGGGTARRRSGSRGAHGSGRGERGLGGFLRAGDVLGRLDEGAHGHPRLGRPRGRARRAPRGRPEQPGRPPPPSPRIPSQFLPRRSC